MVIGSRREEISLPARGMTLQIQKAQVYGVVRLAKDVAVEGEGEYGKSHTD